MKIFFFDFSDADSEHDGSLSFRDNCKIWMKNCRFEFGQNALQLGNMSDLYLDDCSFFGGDLCGNAIRSNLWSGYVDIRNCKFERCGQRDSSIHRPAGAASCIEIGVSDLKTYGSYKPWIKFKCIGCVFKNNRGYTVGILKPSDDPYTRTYDGWSNINIETQFELKHNELKGYNGLNIQSKKVKVNNANKVYHNTETQDESAIY